MGRHKTVIGRCRLCGERKVLTFEHIPPKSSFNKNTGYYISSVIKTLESEDPFNDGINSIQKQGGVGNNSLCGDCNNFLGRKYVDSYRSWVLSGFEVLKSIEGTYYEYQIEGIEPLKIIKQIFSMFISFGDEDFYKNHTELCDFVRNPISNNLSNRYQIFTYLNNEGKVLYIPPMVTGNLKTHIVVFCTELTFQPYGYVFTIDSADTIEKLTNITSFKNYKLEDKVKLEFRMNKLPNHLPFPLDYRTKEEINDSIRSIDI